MGVSAPPADGIDRRRCCPLLTALPEEAHARMQERRWCAWTITVVVTAGPWHRRWPPP